MLNFKEEV